MTDDSDATLTAVAIVLHDLDDCYDGETTETCGKWQSGDRYPSPSGATHQSYYQDRARKVLDVVRPLIVAEAAARERQRIINLADDAGAFYLTYEMPEWTASQRRPVLHRFADLLGADGDAATSGTPVA